MAGGEEVSLVTATFVVMAVIFVSVVIVVVVGPIADMADAKISETDSSRALPNAANVMHQVHDYLYLVIGAANLLMFAWYIKLIFSRHTYTREF